MVIGCPVIGQIVFRCTVSAAVIALASGMLGCAALEDTPERFPEDRTVEKTSLVREWEAGSATLSLGSDSKFDTVALSSTYYDCPSGEAGVNDKSGSGTWKAVDSDSATEVYLNFNSGCYTKFWVGEADGKVVLWNFFEERSGDALLKLE